jgi:HEAT repeat protein
MDIQTKIDILLELAKNDSVENEKKKIDFLLNDPAPEVRATAAGTLVGMFKDGEYAIPALLKALVTDKSTVVREQIMSTLISNWIPKKNINKLAQFLPILVDLMKNSNNKVIRLKTCNTFIKLVSIISENSKYIEETFDRLLEIVQGNFENPKNSEEIKIMAIECLGYCKFSRSEQILKDLYNKEKNIKIKAQSIRSYGRLKGKESIQFLDFEYEASSENYIKAKILETYGILKAEEKIPKIINILRESQDPLLREFAAKSLGEFKIKSDEIMNFLKLVAENDVSEDVRYAAYLSYEKINCPGCISTFTI